ncbi:MAG: acyl-CoA dehydrogenase family protein [Actinomycetota bacterium]
MSEFLSGEWLAQLDAAARAGAPCSISAPFTVEQVVVDIPGRGEVRYRLRFDREGMRVSGEITTIPDLTLIADYATAVALSRGALNAQHALAQGRLRLRGHVDALVRNADALSRAADSFGSVRAQTTYRSVASLAVTTIDAFGARAKAFLDEHAEPKADDAFEWGKGPDRIGLLEEKSPAEERRELDAAKQWRARMFDAGFSWITGPVEYGGRGLTSAHDRVYRELESEYRVPSQSPFAIGLGMVAPTILAHAIEEVKHRYLQRLWRGDIVGCQLFSEPVAGSDIAGIQTRAVRDGEEWRLSGQKVWTSGAQYSDIGEIITRTDPDKPKHKGLTMFLVDMHAPGVEVRPLRQMTGGASFNEVFFDEVRVPDSHRLGDIDEGWTVALTTLMNERASIGGGGVGASGAGTSRLIETVRRLGMAADPLVRDRIANLVMHSSVAKYNNLRAMAKIRAGQLPGPEMSIAKLSLTSNMRRTAELASEVLGPRLVADTGEWGTFSWAEYVLGVPGIRIAGGTDEVMRNIIGERVLGLPKEPQAR